MRARWSNYAEKWNAWLYRIRNDRAPGWQDPIVIKSTDLRGYKTHECTFHWRVGTLLESKSTSTRRQPSKTSPLEWGGGDFCECAPRFTRQWLELILLTIVMFLYIYFGVFSTSRIFKFGDKYFLSTYERTRELEPDMINSFTRSRDTWLTAVKMQR